MLIVIVILCYFLSKFLIGDVVIDFVNIILVVEMEMDGIFGVLYVIFFNVFVVVLRIIL